MIKYSKRRQAVNYIWNVDGEIVRAGEASLCKSKNTNCNTVCDNVLQYILSFDFSGKKISITIISLTMSTAAKRHFLYSSK